MKFSNFFSHCTDPNVSKCEGVGVYWDDYMLTGGGRVGVQNLAKSAYVIVERSLICLDTLLIPKYSVTSMLYEVIMKVTKETI